MAAKDECTRDILTAAVFANTDRGHAGAGFSPKGAHSSATRLLQNAQICARIAELQEATQQVYVTGEIANRTYRVALLQEMIEEMRPASREQKRTPAQVRETRECLKQAAVELGQFSEKQDVTLRPAPSSIDYSKVPLETIEASLAKMREARAMLMIDAAPVAVEELSDVEST